jgi:hypothetical protein
MNENQTTLKGHTTIELTDVNTGEVQKIEEDNLVTDALAEMFWSAGFMGSEQNKALYFPVYQKLLGGLILWENTIPENADRIFEPAGNRVTGTGIYGLANNGTNLVRGTYNTDESSVGETIIKHVWDFTTNQANGKISAVSLCTDLAAKDAYGTPYTPASAPEQLFTQYDVVSTGWASNIVAFDELSGYAYGIDTISSSQIALVTYDTNLKSIPVTASEAYGLKEIARKTFDLNVSLGNNNGLCLIAVEDGHIYLLNAPTRTFANNAVINIIDVNIASGTANVTAWKNCTGQTCYTTNQNGNKYCSHNVGYHQGYVYVQKSSAPYTLYRAPLNNATAVETLGNLEVAGWFQYARDGRVYWWHQTYAKVFDTVTKELRYLNCRPVQSVQCLNSPNRYLGREDRIIRNASDLICTINNLGSAVTKSESQTMKITYTITQE